MSKIKIFSLGGLNENGKNMYVIEVDNDIFVMDAGLKYADEHMLGIDYMIPDIKYLKDNYKRIKGLFLTHGHFENNGALPDLLKDLDGINIYGSKFTIDLIKNEFSLADNNFIELQPYKSLTIGNVKIFPVNLSHSIPDNFGYEIKSFESNFGPNGKFCNFIIKGTTELSIICCLFRSDLYKSF